MMKILFLIAALLAGGAFFVDDHFVQVVLLILAIVLAFMAYSGASKKQSINEWFRLTFWP